MKLAILLATLTTPQDMPLQTAPAISAPAQMPYDATADELASVQPQTQPITLVLKGDDDESGD